MERSPVLRRPEYQHVTSNGSFSDGSIGRGSSVLRETTPAYEDAGLIEPPRHVTTRMGRQLNDAIDDALCAFMKGKDGLIEGCLVTWTRDWTDNYVHHAWQGMGHRLVRFVFALLQCPCVFGAVGAIEMHWNAKKALDLASVTSLVPIPIPAVMPEEEEPDKGDTSTNHGYPHMHAFVFLRPNADATSSFYEQLFSKKSTVPGSWRVDMVKDISEKNRTWHKSVKYPMKCCVASPMKTYMEEHGGVCNKPVFAMAANDSLNTFFRSLIAAGIPMALRLSPTIREIGDSAVVKERGADGFLLWTCDLMQKKSVAVYGGKLYSMNEEKELTLLSRGFLDLFQKVEDIRRLLDYTLFRNLNPADPLWRTWENVVPVYKFVKTYIHLDTGLPVTGSLDSPLLVRNTFPISYTDGKTPRYDQLYQNNGWIDRREAEGLNDWLMSVIRGPRKSRRAKNLFLWSAPRCTGKSTFANLVCKLVPAARSCVNRPHEFFGLLTKEHRVFVMDEFKFTQITQEVFKSATSGTYVQPTHNHSVKLDIGWKPECWFLITTNDPPDFSRGLLYDFKFVNFSHTVEIAPTFEEELEKEIPILIWRAFNVDSGNVHVLESTTRVLSTDAVC